MSKTLEIIIPENYVFVYDDKTLSVGMADQNNGFGLTCWLTFSSKEKIYQFKEMLEFILEHYDS